MATAARFWPGTPEYESLNAFEKVEACQDHIALVSDLPASQRDPVDLADLTDEEGYWRRKAALLDPLWDIEHNHHLADEHGNVMLLKPRPGQEILFQAYLKAQEEERAFRALLPKPRRLGMSAGCASLGYNHVFRAREHHGILLAQKGQEAEGIFRKVKLLHRHDPIAPDLSISTKTMIGAKHSGSTLSVQTVGGSVQERSGIGRGLIFHYLWGSEVAYWPDAAIAMMTGLLSTMPRPPVWNTAAILESTGNGRDGYFFWKCQEAIEAAKTRRPGQVGWECIFIPWTELHDCYLPISDQEAAAIEKQVMGPGGNEEERILLTRYGATPPMIAWRRYALEILIEGVNTKAKMRNFRQEYPLTVDECFQASGGSVWDLDSITAQMRRTRPPSKKNCGRLTSPFRLRSKRKGGRWGQGGRVHVTPEPALRQADDGPLRVWKRPQVGHRYMLAVDPAAGVQLGDPSVIGIMDRDTRRLVAEWRDWVGEVDLEEPVRLLARWYNNAHIIIECNMGRSLIRILKDTDRRRWLFIRRDERMEVRKDKPEEHYGFWMGEASKKALVRMIAEELEHNPSFFQSQDGLEEMKDFRAELNRQKDKILFPGVKHGSDRHDDRCIVYGLLLWGDAYTSLIGMPPPPEDPGLLTVADRWDVNFRQVRRNAAGKPAHPELGDFW